MRSLIALAAASGLAALASGAQAAPMQAPVAPGIVQADWYAGQHYCGPECRYWRHRRWEREQSWRYRHNYGYYGYNYGYHQPYYYRGY